MKPHPTDLLTLDIDLRLTELWAETKDWEFDQDSLAAIAVFMRAAYGKGYCDALTEKKRGQLLHDHGYRVPEAA